MVPGELLTVYRQIGWPKLVPQVIEVAGTEPVRAYKTGNRFEHSDKVIGRSLRNDIDYKVTLVSWLVGRGEDAEMYIIFVTGSIG